MDEENIQTLLERLFGLTYESEYSSYKLPVISRQHKDEVSQVVRQWALDTHDSRLGMLEAKCFAYEQIISNSNFAPMIHGGNNTGTGSGLLEE